MEEGPEVIRQRDEFRLVWAGGDLDGPFETVREARDMAWAMNNALHETSEYKIEGRQITTTVTSWNEVSA